MQIPPFLILEQVARYRVQLCPIPQHVVFWFTLEKLLQKSYKTKESARMKLLFKLAKQQ